MSKLEKVIESFTELHPFMCLCYYESGDLLYPCIISQRESLFAKYSLNVIKNGKPILMNIIKWLIKKKLAVSLILQLTKPEQNVK